MLTDLLTSDTSIILSLFVWATALLSAITIHEFAHAWAADRLGDPTPRIQGRVSLNPFVHLDPLGTIMLLFIGFGWGKPVQFDPYNLQNPRKDAAIISFAGPLSNIALATLLAVALKFIPESSIAYEAIPAFIRLNIHLAVFNLVPIHPLDGGKILVGLLPREEAHDVDRFLQRYGLMLLLPLVLPIWRGVAPIFIIISPVLKLFYSLLLPGFVV